MVCSLGTPYSKLQDYAEDNLSTKTTTIKNSYWHGAGATTLGLANQVTPRDYQRTYVGQNANGLSLRQRHQNKSSRPGRDLTFSAPKSVSLLALVAQKSDIIKAHNQAVNRALDYVESNSIFTRKGKNGTQLEKTNNLVAAVFQHSESRNLDPNLHSHCVIFNQTQAQDGKWRAMDNQQLYQQNLTIGMVYHHELSQQLSTLGHDLIWHRNGTFELVGFDSHQLQQFSSRRAEILEFAGANSTTQEKEIACLATRNQKKYISVKERQEIHAEWQNKSQSLGLTATLPSPNLRLENPPTLPSTISTRNLIDKTIKEVENRNEKTRFFKHELLKEALINSQGKHDLAQLQKEISRHPSLIPTEDGKLTTLRLGMREKRLAFEEKAKPTVLKLATSILKEKQHSNQNNFTKLDENKTVSLRQNIDSKSNLSPPVNEYLGSSDFEQKRTLILVDTEEGKSDVTRELRQALVKTNKLESKSIRTNLFQPKNLDKEGLQNIQNYKLGDAVKFTRPSKNFNYRLFYKVMEIDTKNNSLILQNRLGSKKNLPLNRYLDRQVYIPVRRELRVNEKLRFFQSQNIGGKQIPLGKSCQVVDIDKQRIKINLDGKNVTIPPDKLIFADYNYAATVKSLNNRKINKCIYYPSKNKLSSNIKRDILELAALTKSSLIITTERSLSREIDSKSPTQTRIEDNLSLISNYLAKDQSPETKTISLEEAIDEQSNKLPQISSKQRDSELDLQDYVDKNSQSFQESSDTQNLEVKMVDINGLGETKTSKSPDKQENNNQTKNIAKDGAIAIGKGLFLALATAKIFIDLNEGRQQRDLLALYKIALSKNNSKPKLYEINKNGKNRNKESPSKVKSNIKNPSVKNPQTNSNQVDQQTLESQLFEIAASSKYLANNTQDPEIKAASAEATIRKGSHPNANTIEKDGKTLQFDKEMNVVRNDFSAKEIMELSHNLQIDKDLKMEQNRAKEINRDIGLSM